METVLFSKSGFFSFSGSRVIPGGQASHVGLTQLHVVGPKIYQAWLTHRFMSKIAEENIYENLISFIFI